MAPNVQYSWDQTFQEDPLDKTTTTTTRKRWTDHDDDLIDDNDFDEVVAENDDDTNDDDGNDPKMIGRKIWLQILSNRNEEAKYNGKTHDDDVVVANKVEVHDKRVLPDDQESSSSSSSSLMEQALSQIRIMDSANSKCGTTREWLKQFNGQLSTVPINLIESLR
jgi:hypothetical protein